MPPDFTLTKFRSLCTSISQHYPTLTLSEYFKGTYLPPRFAIMRHDIDRKPGNALLTARKLWFLQIRQNLEKAIIQIDNHVMVV